jgi:alkanesulfonate monooxygenase SsuD/methylene tetrahydromethanopterin reductase-like flavin-dependent oxidoreductase (luciferase family)
MRQLWTEGVATLNGKQYQVDGAICRPLPLQEGGIPLWIAGGGERKTLRIAAQYASYTNFDGSPEGFVRKSELLAEHCREVGTDFDAIVRSANYNVIIGETEKDVRDKVAWYRSHLEPLLPADVLESRFEGLANGPLVGTVEQVAEKLAELRKLGMSYAILYFPEIAYDRSGAELFNRQVAAELA